MEHDARHNPDDCTACSICTLHCPVAMATLKFRGPKMTGPAYERFRLAGFDDDEALQYCSNCKNCEIACPSGVPVANLNMLARAAYCQKNGHAARDMLTGYCGDLGKLSLPLPAFMLNSSLKNPLIRALLERVGIDRRAPLPSFAPLAQRRRLREKRRAGKARVVLFPGCFTRYYEPQVGLDIIKILEKAGYTVTVPNEFVCCGLPLVTGGLIGAARKRARINSLALKRRAKAGALVITPCPSCALMLRHEYGALFPEEEGLADNGHIVLEAGEFILNLILNGRLSLSKIRSVPEGVFAYHAPCHLRALGTGLPALEILGHVPGLHVENMDAGCCGIAGSYGFKKGKYEIAMRVGSGLFAALKDSGAKLALSECGTCRVQMKHGAGLPTAHPLSLLLDCLG
ncbi:MAG: anaerobic glycerol-3-phosphate dehydrogenase subunit C [Desulfovibrio sp.]|jgi:glycerol-3-phosphate dehydrogenase subunit C|nr:anaerobic glycerol-3-phosphate dehydrogenase subunit C [Desulfovibrio sp.]